MSDGVRLTQYITRPAPCDVKRPAVIDRTPYGPTVDEFAQLYLPSGFASVLGNQRGCWTSGGVYNFWKQDGQDALDIMKWVVNQTWSNGEIYIVGISADAISAYSDFIVPNPYILGEYQMWGSAFGHETSYWGGAYRYDLISHWLLTLNTCPNAVNIEQEVREHEAYDEWWAPLEANGPYGNHFPNVKSPGIAQAGWWDIFLQPQLMTYEGTVQYGDPSIRDQLYLFVIPLGHCTGSASDFDFPLVETLVPQELSVAMFTKNYSNPVWNIVDKLNFYVFGPVPAYNGGRNVTVLGNYYTSVPKWPQYANTNYYFLPNGVLSTSKPSSASNWTYTYNPNNTAPSIGANSLYSSSPCGPRDQAKIESRSDVVKWTSAPLTAPLAIVGQLTATLTVSSSAIDTDFFVTEIGRAVQQECRDRSRMPSSA
eukprot:TRINITY_DN723_c0_g1_i21.p1 TRINITY_DN723_c0_g1~~TRINITY_DN723_c0_g1_i21.p1  ORF type:complete len:449 (-),score=57.73 TRINITY_DN723_c0_g1_i21:21-1295(-)